MKKTIVFPFILAMIMVITAGCGQQKDVPQASDPVATEQPAATDSGMDENDIAPDMGEASSVKETYTFFYADKELMGMYRVAQEVEAAAAKDLPLAAVKQWMEGPDHEKLHNLVPPEVVVESLEFKDGIAHISFSRELKNANLGSTGELYLIEQIAQLMKQFGYEKTQILIEGQIEESLLGHVTTDAPISPSDAEQYDWLK